jgi:hypothetical protein
MFSALKSTPSTSADITAIFSRVSDTSLKAFAEESRE